MRPPRWTGEATDADEADVSALLDGDPALAALASDATEPLEDEIRALLLRAAPAPHRRRVLVPAVLALVAVLLLGLLLPRGGTASFRAVGAPWAWVEDVDGTTIVAQGEGVVLWEVERRRPGERFVVRAGALEVEVVGTVFEVGIAGDDAWVDVRRGLVRVRDGGAEVLVPAGTLWERHREVPTVPPAPGVQPPPRPGPASRVVTPVPGIEPAVEAPPPLPARFAALLDRRDRGERSADLAAAFRGFARDAAETPLGAQAEVEALVLEAALIDPVEAVAAVDAWLASHPESPRRLALLEVRAHVARERLHDCSLALPALRELARLASGGRRAEAEAWRGLCATDPAERDGALREALRLGVVPPLRDEVELALEEQR